ncbi:hypothetical protein PROFUN_07868, partial [Planoprotostelium fungivorum]
STVIQNTQPIYEKIVEAPSVFRSTTIVQDRGIIGGDLAALEAQGFNLGAAGKRLSTGFTATENTFVSTSTVPLATTGLASENLVTSHGLKRRSLVEALPQSYGYLAGQNLDSKIVQEELALNNAALPAKTLFGGLHVGSCAGFGTFVGLVPNSEHIFEQHLSTKAMSFAESLLDGFDLLNKRTNGGLKSCGEFCNFYKNFAKVEKEYGRALVKLAQTEKKEFQKASSSSKEVGSTFFVWETIFSELEKIGEFHNSLSNKIENELCQQITNYIKEKEKTKKKLDNDSTKIVKDMKTQIENLGKAKQKYITLTKEAETVEKSLHDPSTKPASIPKIEMKHKQALEKADQADKDYQSVLQFTNQKQTEYYTSTMPSLLKEFQDFEEERIGYMKSQTETWASWNAEEPVVLNTICATITNSAQSITIDTDIKAYCSENATGISPPADIEYAPFESEGALSPKGNKMKTGSSNKNLGKKVDPASKEWGLVQADDFLGDEEKTNKLNGQLEEIDKAIASEKKSRDALENLVRFYGNDPAAKKAEEEITDIDGKLTRLNSAHALVTQQLAGLGGGSANYSNQPAYGSSNSANEGAAASGVRARALYSYSAGADTELSFDEGDELFITNRDDDSWWYAELNGRVGFVPNNYVELLQ